MKTAGDRPQPLGGVCPTGVASLLLLLHNAEPYTEADHPRRRVGVPRSEGVSVDWDKVIGRSRKITGTLNNGVGFLLKKNKIDHYEGHARIVKGPTGGRPARSRSPGRRRLLPRHRQRKFRREDHRGQGHDLHRSASLRQLAVRQERRPRRSSRA